MAATVGFSKFVESLLLGSAKFHEHHDIGLREPQSEVSVWLHGLGAPRDVTDVNVMVAAHPLTIGIGLSDADRQAAAIAGRASLQFRWQRSGVLLGELRLAWTDSSCAGGATLGLFLVGRSRHYCLPRPWRWRYSMWREYTRWTSNKRSGIRLSRRESAGVAVFYLCPRPVALVSVMDGAVGNVFPMDLIGPIGGDVFSLALRPTSAGVPLIGRSGHLALSTVPVVQAAVAYALGRNHRTPFVGTRDLPFDTMTSAALGLPVPRFALRVRELQVLRSETMGSHRQFLCRVMRDTKYGDGLQLFIAHGLYQAWPRRGTPNDTPRA